MAMKYSGKVPKKDEIEMAGSEHMKQLFFSVNFFEFTP